MSVFPDISPAYGYEEIPEFHTLELGPTDGDFIQSRSKRDDPLYTFILTFTTMQASDVQTLYEFYFSMKGKYGRFAFFSFDNRFPYTNINIGTGDASTVQFNLLAKSTSSRVVKVAGTTKTEGTDYTFGEGLGTDGQDRITFAVAPAAGTAITASYTGRKYYSNCKFQDDKMSRKLFTYKLYSTGLVIQEVSA
jgi:hypothetical protein